MATKKAAPAKAKGFNGRLDGHDIVLGEDANVLGAIKLKGNGCVVISVTTFKENSGLDIRRFYLDEEKGEPTWRPTSKGVRLNGTAGVEVIDFLTGHRDEIAKLLS